MQSEKIEMQATCCPHHWLYSCLLSCLQASHPLTQKLNCPPLSLLSHSCGTGRATTPAAVPSLTQRHPQSALTISPKPPAELGKCKPKFLPTLSMACRACWVQGMAALGQQGSPGDQEWEQGDHMKQDKPYISNQGKVIWHPQGMRISTTSPELGQAVVGSGTNLYQDYPEGQCNYLYLNVCTQSGSNGPQAHDTTAGNNPRPKGNAVGIITASRRRDQSHQKTSQP